MKRRKPKIGGHNTSYDNKELIKKHDVLLTALPLPLPSLPPATTAEAKAVAVVVVVAR